MKRQLLRIGICLCTMSLLFSGIFPILPPLEAHAATTVVLTPGQTYNFSDKSDYKKWGAYYVDIKKGEPTTCAVAQKIPCCGSTLQKEKRLSFIYRA